ncbi:hypothetical protein CR205_16085 [Alteribacter lacisalsi]|uniref:2,4-diaminopentanoate dehydrogenase C-terminal domain-containing protein n=1 Tax=Alteribacter lacisalsi TaxID=2045244 RepID=A0A2W0H3Z9_9BACI|nr:hypothetical protein [Alteribacter lacisalsi]PYZ95897.1 hypothetical protein CR205_16085 [Alteribacter lacisalsi]
MSGIKLLQFGLGPIGLEVIRKAVDVHGLTLAGAVDINPEYTGKDVGELAGTGSTETPVVSTIQEMPPHSEEESPRVAVHCTGSNLKRIWPQIKDLLDHGYSVVSTCEELSYPWHRYPALSEEIDAYAKSKGLAVLGTGVNPGFVMDTMTLCITSVVNEVGDVKAERKVDVSRRRVPLQKKVGCGMTVGEFEALAEKDAIGHVGLEESARLIAYGLGMDLVSVKNTIKPVVAQEALTLTSGRIEKGMVCGQHQVVLAESADGRTITLELTMAAGAEQEDRVKIGGGEALELVIPNGVFGDTATAAMALNMAKVVGGHDGAGLFTMADLPLPRNIRARAGVGMAGGTQ